MSRKEERSRSWDPVARWYAGWVGARGSTHHRKVVHPLTLDLLRPGPEDSVLDLGCGTGSLCRPLIRTGAAYTGVDLSRRMIAWARRHQPRSARFLVADATRLQDTGLAGALGSFTAVTFVLSIQDIEPLEDALRSAASALAPGGRLVMAMTHPCFRIPRQSGWSWDARRKLASRRIDRYLTPLRIPMDPGDGSGRPGHGGRTFSYHRPLSLYLNALASAGFELDGVLEAPAPAPVPGQRAASPRSRKRSGSRRAGTERGARPEPGAERGSGDVQENGEIPLFLALRARKP